MQPPKQFSTTDTVEGFAKVSEELNGSTYLVHWELLMSVKNRRFLGGNKGSSSLAMCRNPEQCMLSATSWQICPQRPSQQLSQ